jgi:hypothetical protein
MYRAMLGAAILSSATALAIAQSATAPLMVTANVVSTCRVGVQRTADLSALSVLPVSVTCTRGLFAPRVQQPAVPPRIDLRDAVVVINF